MPAKSSTVLPIVAGIGFEESRLCEEEKSIED